MLEGPRIEPLATAVRDGSVSPTELVTECLDRIASSDGELNAVVTLHADEALAAAAEHPRTGALAGLPLLVKDMARCAGSPTTFGSSLFADAAPDTVDDIVVERLRHAGAIVVGRTNSPSFGHAPFTSNELFGATRNPWNTDRSPGGSSGGSAAALAAGMAPLATTSDGGGSVRIPASCCGLVGYKPTLGAIGRNLLPRWIEFSTQGVTASTVADVDYLARIVLGPAAGDWTSAPAGTVALSPAVPTKVLACRTFRADLDPVIEAAYDEALDTLHRSGIPVERIAAPSDPSAVADWFIMSCAELAQSLGEHRDRWDTLDEGLQEKLRFGAQVSLDDYLAAQRRRHDVGARIDEALGLDAVLALPTLNVQSWGPDESPSWDAGSVTGDATIATNTPELNATGHPAVSVPLGLDDVGVPFGLQIVAPRFADGLALGVAEALERLRPWPLTAPGYTPFGLTG